MNMDTENKRAGSQLVERHSDEKEDGIAVYHGKVREVKGGRKIQAHVAFVSCETDILAVISMLQRDESWTNVSHWPFAMRVLKESVHGEASQGASTTLDENSGVWISPRSEKDFHATATISSSAVEGGFEEEELLKSNIVGTSEDSGCIGAGSKILHLLERWDIFNVGIVTTIWEGNSPKTSKGLMGAFFRQLIDCAKEVLEQCFLDTMESRVPDLTRASVTEYFRKKCSESCQMPSDFSSLSFIASMIIEQDSLERSLSHPSGSHVIGLVEGGHGQPSSQRKTIQFGSCKFADDALDDGLTGRPQKSTTFTGKRYPPNHFLAGREKGPPVQQPRTADEHLAHAHEQYLRIISEPPDFTTEEIRELRSITKPPENLAIVFGEVAKLLGETHTDWLSIRPLFRASDLKLKMKEVIISLQTARQLEKWIKRHIPTLSHRGEFFKTSPVAGKALDWLLTIGSSTAANRPTPRSPVCKPNQVETPRAIANASRGQIFAPNENSSGKSSTPSSRMRHPRPRLRV